jgi:hypothetical protein
MLFFHQTLKNGFLQSMRNIGVAAITAIFAISLFSTLQVKALSYQMTYFNTALLPSDVQSAVLSKLTNWSGAQPYNNTFVAFSNRIEQNWGSFTLGIPQSSTSLLYEGGTIQGYYARSVSTLLVVFTTDSNIKQVLDLIPLDSETGLTLKARQSLFPNLYGLYSVQSYSDTTWKLPWANNLTWKVNSSNGWHDDFVTGTGMAIDFNPNSTAGDIDVLAPINSTVDYFCPTGDNHVAMRLIASDGSNTKYSLIHLKKADNIIKGSVVSQGQKLGVVAKDTPWDNCAQSTGVHIHMGMPAKPFTISGYTFTNTNLADAAFKTLQSGQGSTPTYKFSIGAEIESYNSENLPASVVGVAVRSPGPCDSEIAKANWGRKGKVLEGPITCNGSTRWKIDWGNGLVGWSAEQYLRAVPKLFNFSPWITDGNGTTNQPYEMVEFTSNNVRKLLQTHVGTDKKIYTRYTTNQNVYLDSDKASWSAWARSSDPAEATNFPVSTTVFGTKVYQTHVGTDNKIYTRYSSDAINWSSWTKGTDPAEYTSLPVYMASFTSSQGNQLYQVHVGGDRKIYTRNSTDGVNWGAWTKGTDPNEGTNYPVTMAEFNTPQGNKLFQVHVGDNNRIFTRNSSDGVNWGAWTTSTDPYESTAYPVSIFAVNGKLYETHVGGYNVYTRSTTDGINWTVWEKFNDFQTSRKVTMASFNNVLYQGVVGFDNKLYWRRLV